MAPRARQAKSKARITRYEELREEAERQTEGSAEIVIPVPERLGDEVVIAAESPRATATGCCSRTSSSRSRAAASSASSAPTAPARRRSSA